MENDKYLEILKYEVEKMNKKDKTGLSLVEIMKPYSDLHHYVTFTFEKEGLKQTMKNKYYTPDLEDLRVGYICEISNISYPGFGKFVIPCHEWESHEGCTMYDYLESENLRTKYLDKEDIESLEFKYVDEARLDERGDYIRFSKEWSECPPDARCNDHYYGTYWICLNNREGCISFEGRCKPKLIIYKERHGGFVGGQEDFILFDGDCPSINELKYLMKLLNIK